MKALLADFLIFYLSKGICLFTELEDVLLKINWLEFAINVYC